MADTKKSWIRSSSNYHRYKCQTHKNSINKTYFYQLQQGRLGRTFTEQEFAKAKLNNKVFKSSKIFTRILQKAAKRYIPAGRIPEIMNAMPTKAVRKIEERDQLRIQNPSNPRISELNNEIKKDINDYRKNKWSEHLDTCVPGSKKLWSTIKSLGSNPQQPSNQSISFQNQPTNDPRKMANKFNKQYTPSAGLKPKKETRATLRKLQSKPKDPEIVITAAQVVTAIKKAKSSKALGPDKISPVMMKHLGTKGIAYLTNIYNCSVKYSLVPANWKTGRIIPLLKPGKPADQGKSYRPISLLSPPAKILESILLPYITEAINFKDHQHGFRKIRSTATCLQEIVDHINLGLNKKQPVERTVAVCIDLSRAFDTVDHSILLKDIQQLQLNDHIKRFLKAYIRGRFTYVEFRGAKSKHRKMTQGVPQGGVLSPILFNLYMSKMPLPSGNIRLVTYADDGTLLNSGTNIPKLCQELTNYLEILNTWFVERNLEISPSKSSATIFSTFAPDSNKDLNIIIDGKDVPKVNNPKILGVTFDCSMKWHKHVAAIKKSLDKTNNMMKLLGGTSWGCSKEILTNTWKAVGISKINYASNIYTPNLSDTNFEHLQKCQNAALRTITGCVKMSKIDHLHAETKIMPVKNHNEMLCKQYMLKAQLQDHPSDINLTAPAPPRQMINTLTSKYAADVITHVPDNGIDRINYKSRLKEIHTESVEGTINAQIDNSVLNSPAPKIHSSELTLPRKTRCTLAQLRSGYSNFLNYYLNRIDPNKTALCPDCHVEVHTTEHLFSCTAKPTNLTAKSLWEKPKEAAIFLGLDINEPEDG